MYARRLSIRIKPNRAARVYPIDRETSPSHVSKAKRLSRTESRLPTGRIDRRQNQLWDQKERDAYNHGPSGTAECF
jgi:hypothetical protein